MRLIILLLAFGTAMPTLLAQDAERAEVDLAVGFPANTMVYMHDKSSNYWGDLNPQEIFAGLEGASFAIPNLGELARERLELPLSDAEITALTDGVEAMGFGLLDIGVSSPKLQVVIDHEDLRPLERAMKESFEDGGATVTGVEDYYDTDVFELYLPLVPTMDEPDDPFGFRPSNPVEEWANIQDIWAAVVNHRFLVVATSVNAVKDAVDFLTFPDDPVDTLLGNGRYREAIAEFEDPDSIFFINVQSVIATLERLGGDQGSGGIVNMLFQMLLDESGDTGQFFVSLWQYEQFKSFAAAMWIDEENLTARLDANLVFHNAPRWFDTLRIEPQEMPLTRYIPRDTMFALTDCIDQPDELYTRFKEFFITRARNAGQDQLADGWEGFEREIADAEASIDKTLAHLGIGQALVIIPGEGPSPSPRDTTVAGLLGVKDYDAAREYFYNSLIPSKLGEPLREAESELSPILVLEGVEIHTSPDGTWGFAMLRGEDGAGVFAVGQTRALKKIVLADRKGENLQARETWRQAKSMIWEQGSVHMYMNFGEVLGLTLGGLLNPMTYFGYGMEDGESSLNRDATLKDADPAPYLADFFSNTVVAGAVHSRQNSVHFRITAAGWPNGESLRGMALHFRDVQLNVQVRDDFVHLRQGARDHLVMQGRAATEVRQLLDLGYITDEDRTLDPFGAVDEEEAGRPYALAPVPDDVDIRQAVLCAYQLKPGLRGNHLCVLWNSHIVELTPAELVTALELAGEGKPLPEQTDEARRTWYEVKMKPLHEEAPVEVIYAERYEPDEDDVAVDIIDDDGEVATVRVDREEVMTQTEGILDETEGSGDTEAEE